MTAPETRAREMAAVRKFNRRIVWCVTCGHMEKLARSAAWHLVNGWPKHCGLTMTIDSPEERAALTALSAKEET